jgi:segregation and condensation protein B
LGLKEDKSIVEAALFAAGKPVKIDELAGLLGTRSMEYVEKLVEYLTLEYEERGSSIEVVRVLDDSFAMQLKSDIYNRVQDYSPRSELSPAVLRTLALVAYKQPVKQSEIANIIGTQVYDYVRKLVDRKFIYAYASGRTKILKTTKEFAQYFGFETDEPKEIKEKMKSIVSVE